jgi:outer membrane protein assembly factor BamB
VYVTAGRKATTIAVRAGGRGDVTDSHVLWRTDRAGAKVPSPVYHDGHLYLVHDGMGAAICLDAETGDIVYRERFDPRSGTVWASPILADGKLYIVSHNSGAFVVAAKPEYELMAHNTVEDDSRTNASISISDGQLFLRSDRCLYCISE